MADTTLSIVDCGSTGLSLLTANDGGKRFFWPAIAGVWKPYIGGGTPRDYSPCGVVLDQDKALLFKHVESYYDYYRGVDPPVVEALLVPFYVGGKAVGTLWAVTHDQQHRFDSEDRRVLQSLATFASLAY